MMRAFGHAAAFLLTLGVAFAQEPIGDGDRPHAEMSAAALLWGSTGWRRHVADVNGDGLDDILYHSVATLRRVDDQPDGTARFSPVSSGLAYRVFQSNGDGTFTAFPVRTALPKGQHCRGSSGRQPAGSECSLIDIDADGLDDLVLFSGAGPSRPEFDRIRILYFRGQGRLQTGPELVLPAAIRVGGGWRWAWADTNGDGLSDILNFSGGGRRGVGEDKDGRQQYTYDNNGLSYRIFESNGDGSFVAHPQRRALPTGHFCGAPYSSLGGWSACTVADADGDGRSDLVIASTKAGAPNDLVQLRVLYGTPGGRLSPGPERELPAAIRTAAGWRWRWVRLNEDGRADILNFASGARYRTSEEDKDGRPIDRLSSSGLEVQGFVSQADGTFSHVPPARVLDQGSRCLEEQGWRCDSADVDGDGVADILSANPLGGVQAQAFLGSAGGGMTAGPLTTVGKGGPLWTRWSSEFADVNGDGRADVVFLDSRHRMLGQVSDQRDDAAARSLVLLSNGDGTFTVVDPGPRARTQL